jgi:hypothetical protein
MNHRTWPVLLLAAGCWIGVGRFADAQTMPPAGAPAGGEPSNPSHLPIPTGSFDPKNAEEMLAHRLRRFKEGHEHDALRKLVENLLKDEEFKKKLSNPAILEELQKKAKTDPGALADDPRFKPLFDKIRENPEFQKEIIKGGPSPELLEDLKKQMMEKLRPGAGSAPTPPANQGGPSPMPLEQSPPKESAPPPVKAPLPRPQPPPPTPPAPSPAAPPPHIESSSWINRQLKGLTHGLLEHMGDTKNSPWLRDFFKNVLDQKSGEGGLKITPLENTEWARRLEGLKEYLPPLGGLFDKLGSPLRNWNIPAIGGDWSVPLMPSLPSMSSLPAAPDAPSARGGLTVLWLGFLAVAALLVWKLVGRQRARVAAALSRQWLGPWPVSPAAVRTREELVRAFDYLALLALGPAARACNHLDVAGQLGQQPALDADRRREAANHLARVYEKARYAPGDEPLPDEEMAGARRELCLLAGVAGA